MNFDLLPDVAIERDEPRRLQPGVRPERARRRAEHPAQERLHLSRRRDRALPAARSAPSAATSSTASRAATPPSMSRRAACTRTAGAICSPPASRTSTATWAGAATPARCISMSSLANSVLNGPGTSPVQLLAADPAAQFTGPNADQQHVRAGQPVGQPSAQRHAVGAGRHLLQQLPPARDQRQRAERHAVQRRVGPAVLRLRLPAPRSAARTIPAFLGPSQFAYSELDDQTTNTNGYGASVQATDTQTCSASTTISSAASASTARRPSSPASSYIGGITPGPRFRRPGRRDRRARHQRRRCGWRSATPITAPSSPTRST